MKKRKKITPLSIQILPGCCLAAFMLLLASFANHPDKQGASGSLATPQSDTLKKPLVKRNTLKIDEKTTLLNNTVPKAPPFKIFDAAELKKQTKDLKLVIRKPMKSFTPPKPNTGNPAYKTGSGVMVTPLNIVHNSTGSTTDLYHNSYSSYIPNNIRNNFSFPIYQSYVPPAGVSILNKYFTFIHTSFLDLPTAQHTYLLTLGASASADQTRIRIYNGDASNTEEFQGSDLVENTESNELRLLFSYGNIISGPDNSYRLWVDVSYKPKSSKNNIEAHFNHIQLVQID